MKKTTKHSKSTINYLSNIVEREPGEKDVGKKLCHTEDSIHHPVGQPLGVILFGGTFNGLNSAKRSKHKKAARKMSVSIYLSSKLAS